MFGTPNPETVLAHRLHNAQPFAPPLITHRRAVGTHGHPVEHRRDRGLVLDCLRVRDLGGPWLDRPSFNLVEDRDAATAALVRDGLAAWDDLGIHITPRGRREWADQRNALRDLSLGIEGAA